MVCGYSGTTGFVPHERTVLLDSLLTPKPNKPNPKDTPWCDEYALNATSCGTSRTKLISPALKPMSGMKIVYGCPHFSVTGPWAPGRTQEGPRAGQRSNSRRSGAVPE